MKEEGRDAHATREGGHESGSTDRLDAREVVFWEGVWQSGRVIFPNDEAIYEIRTRAPGPAGALPLTDEMLRKSPSGDIFGLTQNVGMGWEPALAMGRQFLILSTQGGLRAPDGRPIALGYHTGHWEIGLLVEAAAVELRGLGAVPFAAYCSDPCDGRTQGTAGMFDSLPFRNDAALVFRRLIRSLPRRAGVIGHRDVRQGAAGDDDGAGGDARSAVRAGAGRGDAAADGWGGRGGGADDRGAVFARGC